MSRQTFDTIDVLRLEVANDPAPGTVSSDVRNRTGDLGGWGWLSPVENTRVRSGSPGLTLETVPAQSGVYFTTDPIPVKAGAGRVSLNFQRRTGNSASVGVRGRVDFYDADGVFISSTTATAILTGTGVFGSVLNAATPAGTASLKARFDLFRSGLTALTALDSVTVDDVDLYQHTSAEYTAGLVIESGWTDILGPTHEITVERAELNLGTLTATIWDSTLDPSQSGTLRPGKKIRLLANPSGSSPGVFDEYLFAGEIRNAQVAYHLTSPDETKRAQISLSAVDQAQPLSNNLRPDGVAAIAELPAVFEGCGVPWNVNNNTGHTATTPAVVSRNDNASAMDQVAITRDSNHGFAWFSRIGVVQVWDPATLATYGPALFGWPVGLDSPLDESVYNPDISIDYDTDRCINHVTLKYLRLDPATGESEEITYGPYVDDASRAEWGTHAAEFTVHGITEDDATLESYAATILAANATPAVRLNEATVPINAVLDDVQDWGCRDLYDRVRVVNTAAGIAEYAWITRLTHRITGDKWLVTFGFTTEGGIAQPQVTPSPPPTSGKTLAQLLRPVGEVTMWYGAAGAVPAGWLLCNGAAFSGTDYPELATLLGGTNTPNMIDNFPIGAGTKALGTAGGNPTQAIGVTHLPATEVRVNLDVPTTGTARRVTSVGGTPGSVAGSTATSFGGGTPLPIMPPWRALYFIIRAR